MKAPESHLRGRLLFVVPEQFASDRVDIVGVDHRAIRHDDSVTILVDVLANADDTYITSIAFSIVQPKKDECCAQISKIRYNIVLYETFCNSFLTY